MNTDLTRTTQQVEKENRGQKLATILRKLAILSFTAAAGIFLFQGWQRFDTLLRVLVFSGITSSVGALGVHLGSRFRDAKTARAAIATALFLIPICITQYGALSYSFFGYAIAGPKLFILKAESLTSVLMALGGSLVLFLPLSFLSFSVLVRERRKELTALFWGLAGLLLIPTRDPLAIALFTAAGVIAYYAVNQLSLRSAIAINTFEGKIARFALLIPLTILILRNLVMYGATMVFSGVLLMSLGGLFFFAFAESIENRSQKGLVQFIGSTLLSLGWMCLSQVSLLGDLAPTILYLPGIKLNAIQCYPIALLYFALSPKAESKSAYAKFGTFFGMLILFLDMAYSSGTSPAVFALSFALFCILFGNKSGSRFTQYGGVISFVWTVVVFTLKSITLPAISPWVALCGMGVVLFGLATFAERRNQRVSASLSENLEDVES